MSSSSLNPPSNPASKKSNKSGRFSSDNRIKRRSQFLELQSRGNKKGSKHFLLITRDPSKSKFFSGLPLSRLGITVSKKVHKHAVQRNKIKRRLREIFRHNQSLFSRPVDMVIICRKGSTELGFAEIEVEILCLLRKAGLLSSSSSSG